MYWTTLKNAGRPGRYPENDGLNWEGIEFPVKVSQTGRLEKQIEGLAINVFGCKDEGLTILRVSSQNKTVPRINLMLIVKGENTHYCWIKNLGRLLYGKNTAGGQQYHCHLCLSRFTDKKVFEKHQELCEGVNGRPVQVEMPKKGSTLKFEN